MLKNWRLAMAAMVVTVSSLGFVMGACGDDDKDDNGGTTPGAATDTPVVPAATDTPAADTTPAT